METIKNNSKMPRLGMLLTNLTLSVSCATDPESIEAINSASTNCQNIIGIEMSHITDNQRAGTNYGGKGVYVNAVIPQHPASMAGVKAGDIILSINSIPVANIADALLIINNLEPGGRYPFQIYRMIAKPEFRYLIANILIEKVKERAIGKIS